MHTAVIQVVTSLFGSLGFALMFNLGRRHVIPAAINGMCTWTVYLIVRHLAGEIFIPALAASLWAAIFAETAARILKAPANQYLIVGLIPLLPGAPLYYTLSAAFYSDWDAVKTSGNSTVMFALGIAAGICAVCGFDDIMKKIKIRRRHLSDKDKRAIM